MKKIIATALLCATMLAGAICAKAQTVTKSSEFSTFTAIDACYNYEIVIKDSPSHKVEWIVDEIVEDLVQIYQQGSVLKLAFDKKAMTKEQKKYFKGKNAPKMTLKVTIYTPDIESLTIKDEVHVDASGATFNANSFNLSMEDETTLNTMTVKANSAVIQTSDKAVANMTVDSRKIEVKGAKKSAVKLNVKDCEQLIIKSEGDFDLDIAGDVVNGVSIQAAGSSKIALEKGTTPQLLFTSKNSAELDATAYETRKAEFAMTGGKAYINATEVVKLDLKGSLVSFMNDPVIDIVKVEKSTITHFNGKK
ncbi:MAG: DUF2807 domain-containing protein [Bacteroidales bacterium]|nr:DUF2807 domain-containing protein [Bacteroidales bacterium]